MDNLPTESKKIAAVVLNFNSCDDTKNCCKGLISQSIETQVIIVDNYSDSKDRNQLISWFNGLKINKVLFESSDPELMHRFPKQDLVKAKIILVLNDKNAGYAAGNNIGLRIAEYQNMLSVLILNPDIQINDSEYLAVLEKNLFLNDDIVIAASQITNQDGMRQNPLIFQQSFWKDFFWFFRLPYLKIKSLITLKNVKLKKVDVIDLKEDSPQFVQKVSGACFLIKMEFLKDINFLDEGTFLYLEETILSVQAIKHGKKIIFIGNISILHLHDPVEKKISPWNSIIGVESYLHYLNLYSPFNKFQKILLKGSNLCLLFFYKLLFFCQKIIK